MHTERIIMEKTKNGVLGDLWQQRYLREINDELLELYNTPGMALHFQPTKLKILKEQIEKLIKLETHL
jgi:hypothetical protein